MSTVVHSRRNRTVWRGLAGEGAKSDGLFVHRVAPTQKRHEARGGVPGEGGRARV